jgi:hypothetical protein
MEDRILQVPKHNMTDRKKGKEIHRKIQEKIQ